MGLRHLLLALLAAAVPGVASAQSYERLPVYIPDVAAKTPGLQTFVTELREIVARRDLGALNSLVAADFRWERDHGGGFVASDGAVRNFNRAVGGNYDEPARFTERGWRWLAASLASKQIGFANGEAYCQPPEISFAPLGSGDLKQQAAFQRVEAVAERFNAEFWFQFGYTPASNLRVRDRPSLSGQEIGRLTREAVYVPDWQAIDDPNSDYRWVKLHLPSGEIGYAAERYILSLLEARLCYGKRDAAWKITVYQGGGD